MSDAWYVARIQPVSLPPRLVPREEDENRTPAPYRYAARNLREQGFEVYCPCIVDQVIQHGKKQTVLRAIFPGYLFIMFDLRQEAWWSVNATRGVVHLLPLHTETPQSVPDQFIDRMRDTETAEEADQIIAAFSENDVVRILVGPFQGHTGSVKQSRAGSTRVEIPLFGRTVVATVPTADLILT